MLLILTWPGWDICTYAFSLTNVKFSIKFLFGEKSSLWMNGKYESSTDRQYYLPQSEPHPFVWQKPFQYFNEDDRNLILDSGLGQSHTSGWIKPRNGTTIILLDSLCDP